MVVDICWVPLYRRHFIFYSLLRIGLNICLYVQLVVSLGVFEELTVTDGWKDGWMDEGTVYRVFLVTDGCSTYFERTQSAIWTGLEIHNLFEKKQVTESQN